MGLIPSGPTPGIHDLVFGYKWRFHHKCDHSRSVGSDHPNRIFGAINRCFSLEENAPMLSHWVWTTVKKPTSNLSGGILGLFSSTHLSYHHPGHPQAAPFLRPSPASPASSASGCLPQAFRWDWVIQLRQDHLWCWIHDPGTFLKHLVWALKCPYAQQSGEWNNSIPQGVENFQTRSTSSEVSFPP